MASDDTEEEKIEISLRPVTFDEYIGQEHLKNNIKLAIEAVKKRSDGSALDHVLLYGPPGLGKTTMAGVIAHELGHYLGLPDLYLYEVPEGVRDCFAHCGTFDLMGLIEGLAPDYLAYHKWRLGWIDDDQTAEAARGEVGTFTLTPVEVPGGLKLVNIPLDGENGYIAEYRTPTGLDEKLGTDGVLVYRISAKVPNGMGCVTVIPPEPEKYLALDTYMPDGLLLAGQTVEREGVRVTHLGGGRIEVSSAE